MTTSEVPTVDFSAYASAVVPPRGHPFEPTAEQAALAPMLREALTTHGFVYAAGLLAPEELSAAFAASRQLFDPASDRSRLPRLGTLADNMGYGGVGHEALNARRAPDAKELYHVAAAGLEPGSSLMDGTPEGFAASATRTWHACASAAQRALLAFGVALGLSNPSLFAQSLNKWELCTLRLLHYPEASDAAAPSETDDGTVALACGEHTDFGILTVLLLEDGTEGLEVRRPDGGWIQARGIGGTVLLNTGAMLARWCNDVVMATPHRVVLPSPAPERYSIAFFVDPDAEEMVEPIPEFCGASGSKYAPISAGDLLEQCISASRLGEVSEEARRSLVV